MSFQVILLTLGLFSSTWNANEKYSLGKQGNLPQPSETQLHEKLKVFSHFSIVVLKSTQNFEHLKKR